MRLFPLRRRLARSCSSVVRHGDGAREAAENGRPPRLALLAVGAAVATAIGVGACRTAPPVVDAAGLLRAAPAGSHLAGEPLDVGAPEVINRRDFIYAVSFDDAGQALAFSHHVSTHMELTVTDLSPLSPRFQEKVNVSEFDVEDVVFFGGDVVVPSRQGTLRAFSGTDGKLRRELATGEGLVRVAVSPDRALLAASTSEGRLLVFDAASFALRGEARVHDDEVRGLAFLPDGRLLTASFDGLLKAVRFQPATQAVAHLTTSALASGDRVFLTHIAGAQAVATVRDARQATTVISRAAVKRLRLSTRADGATLTVTTAEGAQQLPVVDVGELRARTLTLGTVTAALCDSCVPVGAELVLGADVLARIVVTEDVGRDELVVRPVEAAADGARLADGGLELVVEKTLELPGPATDLDVAPRADRGPAVLVSFSATRAARTFELHDAERRGRFPPASPQSGAAFVDVERFALGRRFVNGHLGFTVTGAVSPDGRTVVTGGWDKRVLVWNAVTGELVTERSLAWLVRRARVGPRGDVVAVAAWTPVNALNDGESDPSLLLYPLALAAPHVVADPR
jgi:hypothetical protein